MIEAVAETRVTPTRGPVAAVLGLLSVALLGASFVWAHHWGMRADTLVVCWVLATLSAFVVSIQTLRDDRVWLTRLAFRLAQIGLVGGILSIALTGLAFAAGINPAGACGGG
jgi:hypothetical protein